MAAEQAFLGVLDFDENLLRFYVPLRGQMRTGFCDTQLCIAIPIFVALSANLKPIERARQALRVAMNVAIILVAVLLFGSLIRCSFFMRGPASVPSD
jgi:hypothetical protein